MSRFPRIAQCADLNCDADLKLSRGRHQFYLTGHGQTIRLEVPDSHAFVELLNAVPGRRTLSGLRDLSQMLNACGLRIEVQSQGKQKAAMGRGATSRPFRLLGLPYLECSPRLLWAMLRGSFTSPQ